MGAVATKLEKRSASSLCPTALPPVNVYSFYALSLAFLCSLEEVEHT